MEQNQAIEIHDSILGSGSGWVQKACLCIADATITQSFSMFPAELLNGHIKCCEAILEMIPIPFDCTRPVEVRLETWNNGVLHIIGRARDSN